MSGGSWDYFSFKLEEVATRLCGDKTPLRKAFGKHLKECAEALHQIEWSDSGDTSEDGWKASVRAALKTSEPMEVSVAREEIKRLRDELDNILTQ